MHSDFTSLRGANDLCAKAVLCPWALIVGNQDTFRGGREFSALTSLDHGRPESAGDS